MDEFKYIGVNINTNEIMSNEIQLRIHFANKAYFVMNKMLSSRLLSKGTWEKLYTSFLCPIVWYAYETCHTTQGDERKLLIFEKKFMDLFNFKMVNMREEKKDLERLFNKPKIRLFLKAKRLSGLVMFDELSKVLQAIS